MSSTPAASRVRRSSLDGRTAPPPSAADMSTVGRSAPGGPAGSGTREGAPLRVMHWGWVFGGLLLAVLGGGAVILWLLAEASEGGPQAKLRMDAIRTGLAVMAGVGGAVTLLYAARRQWLHERAQRHQEHVAASIQTHNERVQTHQEQVAAADREHQERLARATEHDASERRVTELFATAVEHLGSDKAAVRLGGLYALERLAVEHPEHRQAIVDVICAYLRMPREGQESGASPGPGSVAAAHEESVRQAAQRMLLRHLKPDAASCWEDVRIDLSGARLVGFDASGSRFGEVVFRDAVFEGVTRFRKALFAGETLWRGASFGDRVMFTESVWREPVTFVNVDFGGEVFFDRACFDRTVQFDGSVRFAQDVSFVESLFRKEVVFDRIEFPKSAAFSFAMFERGASLEHTTFQGVVLFRGASFSDMAMFRWAKFLSDAIFEDARFFDRAAFGRAVFCGFVRFSPHVMHGESTFVDCRITGDEPRTWPVDWREEAAESGALTLVRDASAGAAQS